MKYLSRNEEKKQERGTGRKIEIYRRKKGIRKRKKEVKERNKEAKERSERKE